MIFTAAAPLAAGQDTGTPTTVIRFAGVDTVEYVGSAAYVDPGPDGMITFEYALFLADGSLRQPTDGSHALVIYDAPGYMSDDLRAGPSGFEHALFVGTGSAANATSWYSIDVPASVLASAKGAVTAYAYVHDNDLPDPVDATKPLSKATLYSQAKLAVYSTSTAAAEALSWTPDPIVLVDHDFGVPAALAASQRAQPVGLFAVSNPLVNPGFEVDMLFEGTSRAEGTAYGGTMTTPPWFLRLDDRGTGQPTNPKSTHRVAVGQGPLGSNALQLNYNAADNGKTLMLGQILGSEVGSDALVWHGATGATFDIRPMGDVTMRIGIHYLDASGARAMTHSPWTTVSGSGLWSRVTLDLTQPISSKLLGFYLVLNGPTSSVAYVDNFVINGATMSFGDARSDLTDGMAMIVEPMGLADGTTAQGVLRGATGDFFGYRLSAMDYRTGEAQVLDLATIPANAHSFGFFDSDGLTMNLGTLLRLRDNATTPEAEDDMMVAVVPASGVPATPAAPWGYFGTGDVYQGFDQDVHEPVSGYFSPLKNAIRQSSLADHLDYAGTPVVFQSSRVADDLSDDQVISLIPLTSGDFGVRVRSDTPFIETTTLQVLVDGVVSSTWPVVLDSAGGNVVDGLTFTSAELPDVMLRTSNTLFSRGDVVSQGSITLDFGYCWYLPAAPNTCLTAGLEAGVPVEFTAIGVSTTNETLVYQWHFGDTTTTLTTVEDVVTKTYNQPGNFTVKLTATAPSGQTTNVTRDIVVGNRRPIIESLVLIPQSPSIHDTLRATLRAAEADFGDTLSVTWTVASGAQLGVVPPTLGGNVTGLLITPEVLLTTVNHTGLQKGATYTVTAEVTDGKTEPVSLTRSVTVGDLGLLVSDPLLTVLPVPAATYALAGEDVDVRAIVSDADNNVTSVVANFALGNSTVSIPLELVDAANNTYANNTANLETPLAVGDYVVTIVALNDGNTTESSEPRNFSVKANELPLVNLEGDDAVDAFETAGFTVNPVDPDGRGIESIQWLVDGTEVPQAANTTSFSFNPPGMGAYTITAVVTDVSGGVTEQNMTLSVDDGLVSNVSIAPGTVLSPTVITVEVVDDTGDIVDDAVVLLKVFNAAGLEVASANRTTGSDGTVTWTVPRTYLGTFTAPGEYTLVVDIAAPSQIAVIAGEEETLHQEYTYLVPPA